MIAEKTVIFAASMRCCATVKPVVSARKTGRFTKGFMMAKNAPKALVSSILSIRGPHLPFAMSS